MNIAFRRVVPCVVFSACALVSSAKGNLADVIGPDGRVYPDFRYAGIPGGIPDVPVVARVSDHGGIPDDGKDDLAAVRAAIAAAGAAGGGAVKFEAGTYELSGPLTIVDSGVVLRGEGRDATTLLFTWNQPRGSLSWLNPQPGEVLDGDSWVRVATGMTGIVKVEIFANGTSIGTWGAPQPGTGEFTKGVMVGEHADVIVAGDNEFRAVATWFDGQTKEIVLHAQADPAKHRPAGLRRTESNEPALIKFVGDRWTGRNESWPLAKDLPRGGMVLTLARPAPLEPGSAVMVSMPPSPRFIKAINSARPDIPRQQMFRVEAVEGNKITLNQPARLDFTAEEKAVLRISYPIRSCGVEDLTVEQVNMLWTDGITFENGWGCWARGVHLRDIGRNPLGLGRKFGEARDIVITGTKGFRAGGGAGYLGAGSAWDLLYVNVRGEGLRHAPNFQTAASGNVVLNSTFISSDAQWHMQFAPENLLENVTIDAVQGTGSYGYGLYTQMPEANIHGPGGGPRNVVWNCDFTSPKSSVFFGGSNQGWIVAYNRLNAGDGPAIHLRSGAKGNAFYGNALIVKTGVPAGVLLEHDTCKDNSFTDNQVFGTSVLATGAGRAVNKGNTFAASPAEGLPARPSAPFSLFAWQRENPRLPTRVVNGRLIEATAVSSVSR